MSEWGTTIHSISEVYALLDDLIGQAFQRYILVVAEKQSKNLKKRRTTWIELKEETKGTETINKREHEEQKE